jgi:hypothetical protein
MDQVNSDDVPPRDDLPEDGDLSASNPTPPDRFGVERRANEEFARNHTTPAYRELLAHLYARWHEFNERFFDRLLVVPHIGVGPTHARRFSQCRENTNYGGTIDITISERIAFEIDTRIVREPWPATGLIRFLDDLLLGETLKQLVLEIGESDEEGYGGYGPMFAAEATRIGPMIGLPEGEVMARRRGHRGRGEPVAATWPWGFRDAGHYLGHVRLSHVLVGGLRTTPPRTPAVMPGVYEYLLYLVSTNQIVRLTDILGRQVDTALEARSPTTAAFERSPHDASGMPLPMPAIEPGWLLWNAGCIRAMAEGILTRRLFDGMPILADALQDAGCEDEVLLGHLRAHTDHTANCWALRLLTERA